MPARGGEAVARLPEQAEQRQRLGDDHQGEARQRVERGDRRALWLDVAGEDVDAEQGGARHHGHRTLVVAGKGAEPFGQTACLGDVAAHAAEIGGQRQPCHLGVGVPRLGPEPGETLGVSPRGAGVGGAAPTAAHGVMPHQRLQGDALPAPIPDLLREAQRFIEPGADAGILGLEHAEHRARRGQPVAVAGLLEDRHRGLEVGDSSDTISGEKVGQAAVGQRPCLLAAIADGGPAAVRLVEQRQRVGG